MDHDVEAARQHHLGTVLHRTALRYPGRTALVWGDVRQTYAELDAAVNATANAMTARGVRRGDRVALLAHNSREFVVVYLALARLAAISVPVNFMLGPSEVAFILDHSGAVGMVTEDALVPVAEAAIAAAVGPVNRLRGVIVMPDGPGTPTDGWQSVTDWEAHPDRHEPAVSIADDDPVQLMYTSGTESRPKGVTLSNRSVIDQFVSCIVDGRMHGDDVEVHALPFYHCAQLHCFLGVDLYLGATSIILSRPDPDLILATVERERATKLFCPPTVWIGLLRSEAFDRHDLSSLRKGYYGASAMPVEVLKELRARLPAVDLWNLYGQTEMAPLATILQPEDQLSHAGSAGRAALNVETCVVDDDGAEVATGVVGEIVHRSPHATLGYWDDEARTAEAFRDGWFHSGDLGVIDAGGYLAVVDRKKDMINTGGENVASREIEEDLLEHAGVAEVAVFGIPHPRWIEAVTAAVVPKGDGADEADLLAFARTRLAGYKVPKYVVMVDELPKNPSGKIVKRELRLRYADLAG
jgi:fatty-acyl-CoA synthase